VAAKAGVSSATVSFVLNNRPGQAISDKVRKTENNQFFLDSMNQ